MGLQAEAKKKTCTKRYKQIKRLVPKNNKQIKIFLYKYLFTIEGKDFVIQDNRKVSLLFLRQQNCNRVESESNVSNYK